MPAEETCSAHEARFDRCVCLPFVRPSCCPSCVTTQRAEREKARSALTVCCSASGGGTPGPPKDDLVDASREAKAVAAVKVVGRCVTLLLLLSIVPPSTSEMPSDTMCRADTTRHTISTWLGMAGRGEKVSGLHRRVGLAQTAAPLNSPSMPP